MTPTSLRLTTCLLLLGLLGCFASAQAQINFDTEHRAWEVGLEPVRLYSSFWISGHMPYVDRTDPLAGFYVRRYFDRVGLRFGTQFGKFDLDSTRLDCFDCGTYEAHGYNFGLYTGASYRLLKRFDWLHLVSDFSWQMYRGQTEQYNNAWGRHHFLNDYAIHEVMLRTGMNLRVPVLKHLFFGTELTSSQGLRIGKDHWNDTVTGKSESSSWAGLYAFEFIGSLMAGVKW
ncbi:MAG: hypothetical protein U0176_05470 [Bacteroidia bacterium]